MGGRKVFGINTLSCHQSIPQGTGKEGWRGEGRKDGEGKGGREGM